MRRGGEAATCSSPVKAGNNDAGVVKAGNVNRVSLMRDVCGGACAASPVPAAILFLDTDGCAALQLHPQRTRATPHYRYRGDEEPALYARPDTRRGELMQLPTPRLIIISSSDNCQCEISL